MTIIALPAFSDNYIWVIVNETKHTLTCVDPGDATPVLAYAQSHGLTLNNILITHHHADHTAGIPALLDAFPAAIVYGPDDQRIPSLKVIVHDEDIVHIDNLDFRVLSTPGHTRSHICYQEPTQGLLFCGDTLFSAGCGRVFEGTMEQLHQSILLLKNLPSDTKVYCGHEYTLQNLRFAISVEPDNQTVQSYIAHLLEKNVPCSLPSTITLERKINPFMRVNSPSLLAFARTQGVTSHDSFTVFKWLRERKDSFK